MSPEQREACVEGMAEHMTAEQASAIAERADAYFDETYPADVDAYLNACLREAWRDDQGGSSARWDRQAKRAGVFTIGKVIL